MMPPAEIDIVAGVIRNGIDGRILITRRRAGAHLAGLWEFPGGKVRPEESLKEALARELTEEVGVLAAVGMLLFETTHAYPDRTVHLHFFECTIVEGRPRAREVDATAWCAPWELDRYPMPEANAPLIRLLRSPG